MKKFILKIVLFSILLVLFIAPSFLILKFSGENYKDLKTVVKKNENFLIGYAYQENNYGYLKWLSIVENKKNEIIVLGSSRVLSFRKEMFQSSFYNAGYTIHSIGDFKVFLESLPEDKYPSYLIIGLDQWMFNINWNSGVVKGRPKYSWANSFSKYPKPNIHFSVYKDLIKGKYGLNVITNNSLTNKIGLNALVSNTGFRNDGSILYGQQISKLINNDSTANDYKFNNTFDRVKNGNNRFQFGGSINDMAINELIKLLSFCKNSNINVIGFVPPFANSVYNEMINSNNYFYINDLEKRLSKIFNEYDYEFYNYPSGNYCNSNDNEFIDGFHGGDLVYANILIDMLKKQSILNEVSNVNKLDTDKKKKKNRFTLYE